MKKFKFFTVCIVLLSAIFINACDGLGSGSPSSSKKSFNYDLRGTWVSNEQGIYSGSLKIDTDTITIDGYEEDWRTLVGDDRKRPFKDYPKRVPLKGYSEEGKIFIEYGGTVQDGIPYTYTETGTYQNKYKLLEFNFGGRKEILQMAVNF
ncbi:MAG: hypothetical protein LBC76_09155 [Treponema sp.]|jgi:hypothetical protein|nr:hypothetical protein [Treponema sp.]